MVSLLWPEDRHLDSEPRVSSPVNESTKEISKSHPNDDTENRPTNDWKWKTITCDEEIDIANDCNSCHGESQNFCVINSRIVPISQIGYFKKWE